MICLDRLDHLVLTVRDVEASCDFYVRVLGMEVVDFEGRKALRFGRQKINLHEKGKEVTPHAESPIPGSGDLCFVCEQGLEEVVAHLRACGVEVEEGPVKRKGATGEILSVYVRDPDMNLLEISNYQ